MKKINIVIILLIIYTNSMIFSDGYFYVNDTNVRIREFPNTDSKIVGMLQESDKVEVIKSNCKIEEIGGYKGVWYKIKAGDNIGWILSCFLEYNLGLEGTTLIYHVRNIKEKDTISGTLLCYIDDGEIFSGKERSSFQEKIEQVNNNYDSCYIITYDNHINNYSLENISTKTVEVAEIVNCSEGLLIIGEPLKNNEIIYHNSDDYLTKKNISSIAVSYFQGQISEALSDKIGEFVDYNDIFGESIFYRNDSTIYKGREYVFLGFLKPFSYNNEREAYKYKSYAVIENAIIYPILEDENIRYHYNRDKDTNGGHMINVVVDMNNDGYPEIFTTTAGYESYKKYVFLADQRVVYEKYLYSDGQ